MQEFMFWLRASEARSPMETIHRLVRATDVVVATREVVERYPTYDVLACWQCHDVTWAVREVQANEHPKTRSHAYEHTGTL